MDSKCSWSLPSDAVNMSRKTKLDVMLTLWAGLLFAVLAQAQTADIAVVVNPSNSVSNISMGELRKVFGGEKRSWPGGTPVTILVRSPGTPERGVLLRLLGMNESDYKHHLTAQVYRGEVQAEPLLLPSVGMTKEAIKAYAGAIALVNARELKPGMKVLTIDGHNPGEEGYPLR